MGPVCLGQPRPFSRNGSSLLAIVVLDADHAEAAFVDRKVHDQPVSELEEIGFSVPFRSASATLAGKREAFQVTAQGRSKAFGHDGADVGQRRKCPVNLHLPPKVSATSPSVAHSPRLPAAYEASSRLRSP